MTYPSIDPTDNHPPRCPVTDNQCDCDTCRKFGCVIEEAEEHTNAINKLAKEIYGD